MQQIMAWGAVVAVAVLGVLAPLGLVVVLAAMGAR